MDGLKRRRDGSNGSDDAVLGPVQGNKARRLETKAAQPRVEHVPGVAALSQSKLTGEGAAAILRNSRPEHQSLILSFLDPADARRAMFYASLATSNRSIPSEWDAAARRTFDELVHVTGKSLSIYRLRCNPALIHPIREHLLKHPDDLRYLDLEFDLHESLDFTRMIIEVVAGDKFVALRAAALHHSGNLQIARERLGLIESCCGRTIELATTPGESLEDGEDPEDRELLSINPDLLQSMSLHGETGERLLAAIGSVGSRGRAMVYLPSVMFSSDVRETLERCVSAALIRYSADGGKPAGLRSTLVQWAAGHGCGSESPEIAAFKYKVLLAACKTITERNEGLAGFAHALEGLQEPSAEELLTCNPCIALAPGTPPDLQALARRHAERMSAGDVVSLPLVRMLGGNHEALSRLVGKGSEEASFEVLSGLDIARLDADTLERVCAVVRDRPRALAKLSFGPVATESKSGPTEDNHAAMRGRLFRIVEAAVEGLLPADPVPPDSSVVSNLVQGLCDSAICGAKSAAEACKRLQTMVDLLDHPRMRLPPLLRRPKSWMTIDQAAQDFLAHSFADQQGAEFFRLPVKHQLQRSNGAALSGHWYTFRGLDALNEAEIQDVCDYVRIHPAALKFLHLDALQSAESAHPAYRQVLSAAVSGLLENCEDVAMIGPGLNTWILDCAAGVGWVKSGLAPAMRLEWFVALLEDLPELPEDLKKPQSWIHLEARKMCLASRNPLHYLDDPELLHLPDSKANFQSALTAVAKTPWLMQLTSAGRKALPKAVLMDPTRVDLWRQIWPEDVNGLLDELPVDSPLGNREDAARAALEAGHDFPLDSDDVPDEEPSGSQSDSAPDDAPDAAPDDAPQPASAIIPQ